MPITQGGGGARRKRGGRVDKYGWETVGSSTQPIPGGYVESLMGGGGGRGGGGGSYVAQLFQPSTPYAEMGAAPTSVQRDHAVETVDRRGGDAGHVLQEFARVSGGQSTDPAKIAKGDDETRQLVEVKRWQPPKTYKMSWDDYLALSDDQRAAVDFNTMLVQAREKDLNTEYDKPAEAEKAAYDDTMRQMFGDKLGSESYAPATMGVLDTLGFKPTAEDDFDEILGGEYLITERDLKKFSTKPNQSVLFADGTAASSGLTGEAQLAASTAKMAEALQRGHAVLQNFRQVAASAVNPVAAAYGGDPMKTKQAKPVIGFGQSEDDAFFRQALEALARTDFDDEVRQAVLADLHAQLGPKNMLPDFMRYADAMTRDPDLYNEVSSWTQGATYFKPDKVRQTLRLDRGGNRDA